MARVQLPDTIFESRGDLTIMHTSRPNGDTVEVVIDTSEAERVKLHSRKWRAYTNPGGGYSIRSLNGGHKSENILSYVITGVKANSRTLLKFLDGNSLNHRKSNINIPVKFRREYGLSKQHTVIYEAQPAKEVKLEVLPEPPKETYKYLHVNILQCGYIVTGQVLYMDERLRHVLPNGTKRLAEIHGFSIISSRQPELHSDCLHVNGLLREKDGQQFHYVCQDEVKAAALCDKICKSVEAVNTKNFGPQTNTQVKILEFVKVL